MSWNETIEISDEHSHYMGMGDYKIILPESNHILELKYIGEPPHGDSYHSLDIDDVQLPGFFWGCQFIFIDHQKYMVCEWMEKLYDRNTVIVDISAKTIYVTKTSWSLYKIEGDFLVLGNYHSDKTRRIEIKRIKDLEFKHR